MNPVNTDTGVWKITANGSEHFYPVPIGLERDLEDWLERDGSLIQTGLFIVGRQVRTDTGPLDLLGLDRFGRWAVIEIKRATLRRETVAQAIDYAGYIAELPSRELKTIVSGYLEKRGIRLNRFLEHLQIDETIFELPRDIQVFAVGMERDASFDRMARYTNFKGTPINAVTFDVLESANGERLLIRKLTELDSEPAPTILQSAVAATPPAIAETVQKSAPSELERLFGLAEENGIEKQFRMIYDAATAYGLYPRTYKWSIMFAPPINKTRVLLYANVKSKTGLMHLYVATRAFVEFFPITEPEAFRLLGMEGSHEFDIEATRRFIENLHRLFKTIQKKR